MTLPKHEQELNAQEQKLFRQLSRIYTEIRRDMNIEMSSSSSTSTSFLLAMSQKCGLHTLEANWLGSGYI